MISSHRCHLFKFTAMVFCLLFDLVINSISDFKDFSDSLQTWNRVRRVHYLLSGLQAIGQMSIFLCLFLLLCNTFPFQIGLLGVLTKRFSIVLWLHLIYFGMTCLVTALRLSNLRADLTIYDIWGLKYYAALSFLQKIVAPLYYAENIKASTELGKMKYYTKDLWTNHSVRRDELQYSFSPRSLPFSQEALDVESRISKEG